ncbi:NUDIX hydrolase [Microbacteriaceae bacterium 4G12]
MDAVFQVNNAVFNYRVAGVFIENGHVLLHKQINDEHWALPGGRVEVLEDSKTALKREMQEELGLNVTVNNLLWSTENFFEYNHKKFHEIGLYYSISLENCISNFTQEAFYGIEGERLICKWVPLRDLDHIILHPQFLKTSLREIPTGPQHLIIREYEM